MIDAHHHFRELGRYDDSWLDTPENKPIRRSYLPEDLKPQIAELGIARTVFVHTRHNLEETRWVLSLSDRYADATDLSLTHILL